MAENKEKKSVLKKWWFWVLVVFVLIIIIACSSGNSQNTTSNTLTSAKPTNTELMSYAQLVLQDNLHDPKFSYNVDDYIFAPADPSGLSYTIKGDVKSTANSGRFYITIKFTDNTYKNYDLILLKVNDKDLYKK